MITVREWRGNPLTRWQAETDVSVMAAACHSAADTLTTAVAHPDAVTAGLAAFLRDVADIAHAHAAMRKCWQRDEIRGAAQ